MTPTVLRVLAGFLSGLFAGILMMRLAYKKKGAIKPEETNQAVMSSRAS